MRYLGCSYGYLIFSELEQCLLVDAYSGATVRPPRLKSNGNHEVYYGILVAPINSPDSHLLLCSRSSMFQWQVGTSSWVEYPLDCGCILQIVLFKGEMFARISMKGSIQYAWHLRSQCRKCQLSQERTWLLV